ncbi:DUF1259 domain-containing protein [Streptomyces sp. 35G-GA-8]|uniref:DUF1259 domain-containing protein n=1 Tax=Streptomyces sp. 35G-GA-8 TaxID=2939434 RepID=UPI00201EA95C|nr:DUF1259 domain-containing protein [Streptomyces sp. 35G-GA-8]MCL7380760.1 DUF1259 domain-containing protein [Streptomyces sp. 35G-GA-8]
MNGQPHEGTDNHDTTDSGSGSGSGSDQDRDRDHDTAHRSETPRRLLLTTAALAPLLAGIGTTVARAQSPDPAPATAQVKGGGHQHEPLQPVTTTPADWQQVARALGREGAMAGDEAYNTHFPRGDLDVVSYGVRISPQLALGSHVAFVRYTDGTVLAMGDLTVTEGELQEVTDVLQAHGIEQTALHKHLLAHSPDVWWTHVHAHGRDPVAIARGLRAALDRTATPPPNPRSPKPLDLDTEGIDAALGMKGSDDGGVYKATFARREVIVERGMALPRGLGAISAFIFQPLGAGKAALNGDVVMVAEEVQPVIKILRRGGIGLVELHNHGLRDEPRLFFIHLWAVADAVELARTLRKAVDATNVVSVRRGEHGG